MMVTKLERGRMTTSLVGWMFSNDDFFTLRIKTLPNTHISKIQRENYPGLSLRMC